MNGQSKDQADQQQAFSTSLPSPSAGAAAPLSPTRPFHDEDAIHLAPEASKLPSSPSGNISGGLQVASERRLSFSQPEARARSRSVGEKQWTRYVPTELITCNLGLLISYLNYVFNHIPLIIRHWNCFFSIDITRLCILYFYFLSYVLLWNVVFVLSWPGTRDCAGSKSQ